MKGQQTTKIREMKEMWPSQGRHLVTKLQKASSRSLTTLLSFGNCTIRQETRQVPDTRGPIWQQWQSVKNRGPTLSSSSKGATSQQWGGSPRATNCHLQSKSPAPMLGTQACVSTAPTHCPPGFSRTGTEVLRPYHHHRCRHQQAGGPGLRVSPRGTSHAGSRTGRMLPQVWTAIRPLVNVAMVFWRHRYGIFPKTFLVLFFTYWWYFVPSFMTGHRAKLRHAAKCAVASWTRSWNRRKTVSK